MFQIVISSCQAIFLSPHEFIIAIGFAINCFYLLQIFWAFSIYLEALAILPQLVLLQRSGNVDNLTGQYVFFLGYAKFSS